MSYYYRDKAFCIIHPYLQGMLYTLLSPDFPSFVWFDVDLNWRPSIHTPTPPPQTDEGAGDEYML